MYVREIFVLMAVRFTFATDGIDDPYVPEITDEDFGRRVAEHELVIVMFYASGCEHCKRLQPEFSKAADDLVLNDIFIGFFKIDCLDTGERTCKRFGITSYPAYKVYRAGKFLENYEGERDATEIVKYLKAEVAPRSQELASVEELENFVNERYVSVVAFFIKDENLKYEFMKLSSKLRQKFKFGHSHSKGLIEKLKTKNCIVLYRPLHLRNKFEKDSVAHCEGGVSEVIESFIYKNYNGLVGHRRKDNSQDFAKPLVIAYYAVDFIKNPKITNYWRNRILKVAEKHKDKINFAVSAIEDFRIELKEFGTDFVMKDEKPFVTAKNNNKQRFIMKDNFSVEALDEFATGLFHGNLTPHVKSQPIPETNDAPVKIAVANNFDDIVNNNGKDTFIMFYAPWCEHCKRFAPTFDMLAQLLAVEDVEFVKMDATTNDIQKSYQITEIPTLYWAGKNTKHRPVKYDKAERELDDFIIHIAKYATDELKTYDRRGKPKSRRKKTEL